MSRAALPRRNPGPRGLETLPRPATQWSPEEEEEAAREQSGREGDRRPRAPEQDREQDSQSPEPSRLPQQKLLQASEGPGLDEDEGFSDWSQKPELQPPTRGESPEGYQEEDRPCENQVGDELGPAGVRLEALRLSPGPEPLGGLEPEHTETAGPEEDSQLTVGLEEAAGTEEQLRELRQSKTPSPLVLEETTGSGSSPLSPSTQLIHRAEALSCSAEKSDSVKRSPPALPVSKIDERLGQYTQAVEVAGKTPKLARQPSIELPSMTVANTKSRWEMGEMQAQSAARSPPCKDIVAGDMSKKSLWEHKGVPETPSAMKSTPPGKKYKFVATGHGKYEKVLMDEASAP